MRPAEALRAICLLVAVVTFLQVSEIEAVKSKKSLASGRNRRVKGKPQADAPLPSRDEDLDTYDSYYDEPEEYDATAGGGSNGAAGRPNLSPNQNGNDNRPVVYAGEETTEVYRQPDDELPTGKCTVEMWTCFVFFKY